MKGLPEKEKDFMEKMIELAKLSSYAEEKYHRDKNEHVYFTMKVNCLVRLMDFMIEDGVTMEYILEGNPIMSREDTVIANVTEDDLKLGYEILKKYKDGISR